MGYDSGTMSRASSSYATDAFRIGMCNINDPWLMCSGGCNDYSANKGGCANCDAGAGGKITIACDGGSTKKSSCTGIK